MLPRRNGIFLRCVGRFNDRINCTIKLSRDKYAISYRYASVYPQFSTQLLVISDYSFIRYVIYSVSLKVKAHCICIATIKYRRQPDIRYTLNILFVSVYYVRHIFALFELSINI